MIRLAALSLALLAAGCKTCPDPAFPRAGDIAAITAPRPKIPPAALDPHNPTAAANYESADRSWGKAVSNAGARICRYFERMGMPEIVCPEPSPDPVEAVQEHDAAARGSSAASLR